MENNSVPANDIQQPENSQTEISEQPLTQANQSLPKKSKIPYIIVGLLVVVLLAAAWFLTFGKDKAPPPATKNDGQSSQNQDNQTGNSTATVAANKTPSNCPTSSNPATFYNKLIGLEFCYPHEWGEANLGEVEGSASDKGQSYQISFSNKQGVFVTSASADWKNTVGRGGMCSDPDPSLTSPNFGLYSSDWKNDGTDDMPAIFRANIMQEPEYIIMESANDFYGGACLQGQAATTGSNYPVQFVSLFKAFNSTIPTVTAHKSTPNDLITVSERTQFLELVASIKRATNQ